MLSVSNLGQVEGAPDDAVGVDAVVAVQVLDRPGLAELRHAQGGAPCGIQHSQATGTGGSETPENTVGVDSPSEVIKIHVT